MMSVARNFRVRSAVTALLAAAGLFGVCAQAMSARAPAAQHLNAETAQQIDAAAHVALSSGRAAGTAVGVVLNGQLVFSQGYGFANLEHQVPVNSSTVFRLASVTKQFTAAAALLLAQRRELGLEDKLAKYFPDFPRGDEVTVRQLLNHTAGIRDYIFEVRDQKLVMNTPLLRAGTPSVPGFVQHIAKLGYDFDPGTRYYYSNAGYFLLGAIIEKVSGKTYGEFIKTNLFEPLGMVDTALDVEAEVIPGRASGYSRVKDQPGSFVNAETISMSLVYAAGAIRSTVNDLAIWNNALYGGQVLNAEYQKIMLTEGRLKDGKLASTAVYSQPGEPQRPELPGVGSGGYTMGLHTGTLDGHKHIGHEGAIYGFSNYIENYSDDGFVVIVLTNTNGGAQRLVMDVARVMFKFLAATRQEK